MILKLLIEPPFEAVKAKAASLCMASPGFANARQAS